jgi:hypothetical protein
MGANSFTVDGSAVEKNGNISNGLPDILFYLSVHKQG